jgi:hypothetical protein
VTTDEYFNAPYVDVDEWREHPVRHRHVHGGFSNTETLFSIYLPPAELYGGRFFQHITPVPDSEHLAQTATGERDKIGFAVASGAYFLETNGGGTSGTPGSSIDPTIAAYRANAAAAQYSRVVAAAMYGEHRPYGYAYGGSGGGFRTIGGAENTTGVWDGVVPYVIGSPVSIPNNFTVRMHAQRLLRHRFDQIIDAVEPGGSGHMYAGLDPDEAAALQEVTRMGFPPRSWFGYRTMGMHAFPLLYSGMRRADAAYFDDFWSTPGYLGHAMPDSLKRDIVHQRCDIVSPLNEWEAAELGLDFGRQPGQARGGVDTAWQGAGEPAAVPVAVRLSNVPDIEVGGAELVITSGEASGERISLLSVADDLAIFGPADRHVLSKLQAGDSAEIDNRGYLAAQTYHRHQVPSVDFVVWDQFRNDDGTPIYPQRPLLLGPLFAAAAAGTVQTGKFEGKMIVVEALLDREAVPWQADWYRSKVAEHLGPSVDDHFRLWYVDHALHGDDEIQESPTHTVSYLGVLHQALRDLSAWVEQEVEPPATTNYEVVDGQVIVPAEAAARRGVQPVVSLTANAASLAEAAIGEDVTFRAVVDVPPGCGAVVSVEWDFDGSEAFAVSEHIAPQDREQDQVLVVERTESFATRGVFFPTVRAAVERTGDQATPYARIQNLARARVVVH